MKSFFLTGAALAGVFAASVSFAQVPPPPGVAQGTAPVAPAPRTRVIVMSDRTMTRDEVVAHVRDFFGRLDANHDGFVTREELDGMHQRMMGMRGEIEKRLGEHGMLAMDRGAMFDRLDANHDGMISRQEFMAAKPEVRQERVMIMRNGAAGEAGSAMGMHMRMHGMGMGMGFGGRLFDMADANHDGRVSLQEAETAALAHFDRADLNHDGKLTPEERSQAHQLMRGQRHPS